jgi:TonB family protein
MSSAALPTSFGRYQVLEELGAGAMGVVYLCVDPRLNRPVAIKVMRESEFMTPSDREQFEARFRHEAEAAGRLTHPDIVQIYDVGPSYIVMEFLEGLPLSALIKRGERLAVRRVVEIVRRMADAVDYAHRHGIIHRDIKPANVMLLEDGGVKVMDFGVARLEHSTLTALGTVVGSVRYMSPEQMMGERVDGRADVFSVAAVAYELLTGRAPFPGKTITEVVSRVVHGAHVPPRQADDRLPESLNTVFARAFAPKPADRYPRACDFARDLLEAAQPALDLEVAPGAAGGVARTEVPAATRTPPPTVLAPAVRSEGLLLLEVQPDAVRVEIDGEAREVPERGLTLPFGRYRVGLKKDGYDGCTGEVTLDPEQPVVRLSSVLPPRGAAGGERRPGYVALGPDVTPPRRLTGELPALPATSGLERAVSVRLDVWVGTNGEVEHALLHRPDGTAYDQALIDAVRRWRFEPARRAGVPVAVRITVQHFFAP